MITGRPGSFDISRPLDLYIMRSPSTFRGLGFLDSFISNSLRMESSSMPRIIFLSCKSAKLLVTS